MLLTVGSVLSAQVPHVPRGMYCGGNQLVYAGSLRGAHVTGIILDPSGAAIRRARIQVQIQGSDKILQDFEADEEGRFRLPRLPSGSYWLGISSPGFNLHYWELKIVHRTRTTKLRVGLSLGT